VTLQVMLQLLLRFGREAADGALHLTVTNLDLKKVLPENLLEKRPKCIRDNQNGAPTLETFSGGLNYFYKLKV
jgi:hypothetical protein